ncbi:MAG: GNAT family N-acetyltransferase [Candidatus Eisenbacteria bacterium]|nr:GNAT family N-acetyltransferase [Candidatus Eisenbacteria bacterium]
MVPAGIRDRARRPGRADRPAPPATHAATRRGRRRASARQLQPSVDRSHHRAMAGRRTPRRRRRMSPASTLKRTCGADDPAYDALLAGREEATFFHTARWARIVAAAFPQIRDLSGVYTAGSRRFALPLFVWRRLGGLLTTTHSSFPFLYGGPIPATAENWEALCRGLQRARGSSLLLGNPFVDPPGALPRPPQTPAPAPPRAKRARAVSLEWDETHLLVLPESVDQYWSDLLTPRKRNDIRRLTKKGVRIERSREPGDVAAVYELYRRRMAAWDRPPGLVYPPAFYRAMLDAGEEDVRLYVARFEEHLIGGTFVCRWNGIVHYNAGYFDDAHRRLRPNVLIQERIIRDAISDGQRLYDMLPSAGLPNVVAFKESFGAVARPFPRWRKRGPGHRLLRGVRDRLRRGPAQRKAGE